MTEKIVTQCSVEGCLTNSKHKGLCITHYRISRPLCEMEGCTRPRFSSKWCGRHYDTWRRNGNPLSLKRPSKDASLIERFWGRVALTADDSRCWEWIGELRNGYGIFNYECKSYRAHRYAWFLVKGYHSTLFLCHKCDNRKCVNPNHLYEGTNQDNIRDKVERGSVPHKQKLPYEVYMKILKDIDKSVYDLSQEYGYSPHIIRSIRNGKHWSNRVYK